MVLVFFFFFQAEDGIRDATVTGVQTCALPICREAPGRVYRCWSAAQHDRLAAQPEPEIAVADLTGFALDLALWGHPDGAGLSLADPPPPGAMQTAMATLRDLGATDHRGRVTPRGRALAGAGLHPRLARALL